MIKFLQTFSKFILITFLLILSDSLSGQEVFAPLGAKWTYQRCDNISCIYEQLEAIRDTMIDSMSCRVLSRQLYFPVQDESIIIGEFTICQQEKKVYHFQDSINYLLYDFGAVPGNSWPIKLMNHGHQSFSEIPATITIDSIIEIESAGNIFQQQSSHLDVEYPDDWSIFASWSFGSSIIGIGSNVFFLPTYVDEFGYTYIFLCYEDSNVYYEHPYINEYGGCNIPVHNRVHVVKQNINIFPNPAKEVIQISFTQELLNRVRTLQFQLLDSQGKLVLNTVPDYSTNLFELDISMLSTGLYWLRIIENDKVWTNKIIVQ